MRAVVLLAVVFAGCDCLPVPSTDTSPPTASVTVEYREPGGQRVTRTLAVGDADITVNADRNDVVAVLYSGGDEQGVRSVQLVYDMRRSTGSTVVQPLLLELKLTGNCPRTVLVDSENFEGDGNPWRYEFSARSENWVGVSAVSGKVLVHRQ